MPISLVEVYQLIADIARQAQESEARAQGLAQQAERLEETIRVRDDVIRRLEYELNEYREQPKHIEA
mgnify:CR=1 FL=1